jgi:signal peptidase I
MTLLDSSTTTTAPVASADDVAGGRSAPTAVDLGAGPLPADGAPVLPARGTRPRPWRLLCSAFGTVVTALAAVGGSAILVVAVVSHFSSAGQYVVFGHPVFTMSSGSMAPAIATGDLVIDNSLTAVEAQHLHTGQVITFRTAGNRTFTHRIVAVKEQPSGTVAYQTKGDVNNSPDTALVAPSAVVGIEAHRIPVAGYVLSTLRQPATLFLLVVLPLLLVVGGPLWRWARDGDATARRRAAAERLGRSTDISALHERSTS